MDWSNYSSLKSAGNASFAKETKEEREYVVLVQKSWDGSTGEANADSSREYSLSDLEREKARYDSEIARAKAQSDELAKAITDFKKV
jgi:hypothetical protein